MQVFTKVSDIQFYLRSCRQQGLTVGFVPTMGALHAGHGSLVARSRSECDVTVASIFVNPTQFNNPDDLQKYPRTIEADTKLLEKLGCDAVFIPEVVEVYPPGMSFPEIPLGRLGEVMEGRFRPGHFRGVVQVVYRLFSIVEPDKAYFGLKDFQQIAVIRHMTRYLGLPVEIVSCPTLREKDGLAMSSRNMRLTQEQRNDALILSRTLEEVKRLSTDHTPEDTTKLAIQFFMKGQLELEYLEIVDPLTLEMLTDRWVAGAVACIVAYAGEVRLIDNMEIA